MERNVGSQKKKIVLLLVVVFFIAGSLFELIPSASHQGYAPIQPIPFNHQRHVEQNQIPCLYCHSEVERSRHASVPSMNICMNCHSVVKVDSPYIQTVRQAFEEGKPIEWVRIHELPDFVYFSHQRHVSKGVGCEVCHGNVGAMTRVEQVSALTMGWCMECHRGQSTPLSLLKQLHPHEQDPRRPIAPVHCSTCHY